MWAGPRDVELSIPRIGENLRVVVDVVSPSDWNVVICTQDDMISEDIARRINLVVCIAREEKRLPLRRSVAKF